MAIINIPGSKKREWFASFENEYSGLMQETVGIDLDLVTRIKVTDRMFPHTTNDDIATIGTPSGCIKSSAISGANLWIMVSDKVYTAPEALTSKFTADATTNTPTDLNDADIVKIWNDTNENEQIVVSRDTDIALLRRKNYLWDKLVAQAVHTQQNDLDFMICAPNGNAIFSIKTGDAKKIYYDKYDDDTGNFIAGGSFGTSTGDLTTIDIVEDTTHYFLLCVAGGTSEAKVFKVLKSDFTLTATYTPTAPTGATANFLYYDAKWVGDDENIMYFGTGPFRTAAAPINISSVQFTHSPLVTVASNHGLLDGDWVGIANAAGMTSLNGYWKIFKAGNAVFTPRGCLPNAAYTSGGAIQEVGYRYYWHTFNKTSGAFGTDQTPDWDQVLPCSPKRVSISKNRKMIVTNGSAGDSSLNIITLNQNGSPNKIYSTSTSSLSFPYIGSTTINEAGNTIYALCKDGSAQLAMMSVLINLSTMSLTFSTQVALNNQIRTYYDSAHLVLVNNEKHIIICDKNLSAATGAITLDCYVKDVTKSFSDVPYWEYRGINVDYTIYTACSVPSKKFMLISNAVETDQFYDYKYETIEWAKEWFSDYIDIGNHQQALQSGYPHPLTVLNGVLFIADKNMIHAVTRAGDVTYGEYTFDVNYHINWMVAGKDKIYLGLVNSEDTDQLSYFAEYDYFSKQARLFDVPEGSSIGYVKDNVAYIIDRKGRIKKFNGSKLEVISQFPTHNAEGVAFNLPHRNGISFLEGKTYILIKNTTCLPSNRNVWAGVWCLEEETGNLYLKHVLADSTATVLDYGCMAHYGNPGFLTGIKGYSGDFICGANIYDVTAGTTNGVFSTIKLSTVTVGTQKLGYFITPRIPTDSINNAWKHLGIKYEPLFNGTQTGTIVAKYRISNPAWDASTTATGRWTSTTTFTTTALPVGVSIGDEIMVISGRGQGGMATISNITGTTTKTITIDGAFIASISGTPAQNDFTFVCENWKVIPADITSNTLDFQQLDIPETAVSKWVQFKFIIKDNFLLEEIQLGTKSNLILED